MDERQRSARQQVAVDAAMVGVRLDRVLRRLLPELPLGGIFKLLRQGRIRVDGGRARPDLRLQAGMLLELPPDCPLREPPPAPAPVPVPWRGPSPRIVHRDADVLVVDKPAGMASQQGGDGSSVGDWLLAAVWRGHGFQPQLAHRIDRGTSGLLAVGLSPEGLRGLTAAFRKGGVHKVYLAIVHGVPAPPAGSIDEPLLEVDAASASEPKVVVDPRGVAAHTRYQLLAQEGGRALLQVTPGTGRLHQIRAHLAWLGHPIVGDRRYGSPVRMGAALLLHAFELGLPHPVHGARLELRSEPPGGFAALWRLAGGGPGR